VISERDCVYFRSQPFFLLIPGGDGEERSFLGFWRDPADPNHLATLRDAGIEYVLVPEVVGDPASWERSWRWQPPALLPGVVSQPADAPYLQLAYRAGGAQVYQVMR
jgi:hypothetical protein